MRLDQALRDAAQRLRNARVADNPRLEAEILLSHALAKPRVWLYTWPEHEAGAATLRAFEDLLRQRLAGRPLAYLTGRREFWSLEFIVDPATLIPRSETELLVETALRQLSGMTRPDILELGCGSGCIACALASERPDARIVASDISSAALAIARRNRGQLGLNRLELRQSDWFDALDGRYDLILSNPPYIAAGDPHLQQGDLPAEPALALVSGEDGLDAIRRIVADAPGFLKPDGWLLLEHGHEQGAAVRALLRARGYTKAGTLRDLAGNERVSLARAPREQPRHRSRRESRAGPPTVPARQ